MDEASDRDSAFDIHLKPLVTALEEWFASKRSFKSLPINVRSRVRGVRGSALLVVSWDILTPGRRRAMAEQLDLSNAEDALRYKAESLGIDWPEDPTWTIAANISDVSAAPAPRSRKLLRQTVKKALGELHENHADTLNEHRDRLLRKVEEHLGRKISKSTLERALKEFTD